MYVLCLFVVRKIVELEEELKVVTNNMKSLEIAEQEVTCSVVYRKCEWWKLAGCGRRRGPEGVEV